MMAQAGAGDDAGGFAMGARSPRFRRSGSASTTRAQGWLNKRRQFRFRKTKCPARRSARFRSSTDATECELAQGMSLAE